MAQKAKDPENVHAGHRQRFKERFLEHGLDNFAEHEVLELLLYYTIPRGDVNPLAHDLINKFGSLANVMNAPYEQLCAEKHVGPNTATLIKLIPQVCRRYLMSRAAGGEVLDSTSSAGKYLLPLFCTERDEVFYIVCMDERFQVINSRKLAHGSINTTSISVRKIVETALANGSAKVIIAHNHTSGIALPSREDIEATKQIQRALEMVGVKLVDHIIVANDDFVSLVDSGFFG